MTTPVPAPNDGRHLLAVASIGQGRVEVAGPGDRQDLVHLRLAVGRKAVVHRDRTDQHHVRTRVLGPAEQPAEQEQEDQRENDREEQRRAITQVAAHQRPGERRQAGHERYSRPVSARNASSSVAPRIVRSRSAW